MIANICNNIHSHSNIIVLKEYKVRTYIDEEWLAVDWNSYNIESESISIGIESYIMHYNFRCDELFISCIRNLKNEIVGDIPYNY